LDAADLLQLTPQLILGQRSLSWAPIDQGAACRHNAFDVLELDGNNITRRPYVERREALGDLAENAAKMRPREVL
jgi:ATP-dependent DNA ligase